MHVRGNKRAGAAAMVIIALIPVVAILTVAIAIYAMQRERAPVRGGQALPVQVAEQLGQGRPAAVPK